MHNNAYMLLARVSVSTKRCKESIMQISSMQVFNLGDYFEENEIVNLLENMDSVTS